VVGSPEEVVEIAEAAEAAKLEQDSLDCCSNRNWVLD
jgi:hypothetical protein